MAAEIIVGAPLEVYVADVGTAFPAINATPSASWRRLGTNAKNLNEDGVTMRTEQTVNEHYVYESTTAVKISRSRERVTFSFRLHDLTVEEVADLFGNAITETPGSPDTKEVSLKRGSAISEKAWLFRGPSPYEENLNAQYQIPKGVNIASSDIQYSKTEMAGLDFEILALDGTDGVGTYLAAAEPVT